MANAAQVGSFARRSPAFYVFDEPEGYRISIPVKSTWLVAVPAMLFLTCCGVMTLYGIDRMLRFEGIESAGVVSVISVLGMLVTCGCIFYWWLWMVGGSETVLLDDTSITIQRDILGIPHAHRYDLLFARDLRVELLPPTPLTHLTMINWRGGGGCCVTFDFEGTPRYFGIGLFEDEAYDLVSAIRQRVRILDRPKRG